MRAIPLIPLVLLAGCTPDADLAVQSPAFAGDPDRGLEAMRRFGCGACHVIPGLREARGHAGPSLEEFSRRVYLAGDWPNEPQILVRFLRDPPSMAPDTLMPAQGIDEATARDIAAYLYK